MTIVTMVVFDGVQALDVSGPLDVFAEANRFLMPSDRYRLQTVSLDGAAVTCSNGLVLQAGQTWQDGVPVSDLLLVAGGPPVPGRLVPQDRQAWLRQACQQAHRFGAICNGIFLLGHAGLLAGRTVTTHWNDAAALAQLCPHARIEADRIYVEDGNLYSSAAVTAGIDLALYLLRRDHGPEVARNVAKRLVVVMQRAGGQSQFSPWLDAMADPASPIAEVQRQILAQLRQPWPVAELARLANMSLRSFTRSFSRETGMAPAQFIQRARIEAARNLLESGDQPVKAIAYECGFGDAGRMRQAFVRALGVSPQRYREAFRQHDPACRLA